MYLLVKERKKGKEEGETEGLREGRREGGREKRKGEGGRKEGSRGSEEGRNISLHQLMSVGKLSSLILLFSPTKWA